MLYHIPPHFLIWWNFYFSLICSLSLNPAAPLAPHLTLRQYGQAGCVYRHLSPYKPTQVYSIHIVIVIAFFHSQK